MRSRRSGRVCLGFIKVWRPRAKLGRAHETDIAGRAAKCAATGAFAAKVDDAPALAKPLTLKDVRGKRPAEDAGQRPTRKPRGQIRAWRAMTKAARQDMRTRRRWLRDQSRSRIDVVARARIVEHA